MSTKKTLLLKPSYEIQYRVNKHGSGPYTTQTKILSCWSVQPLRSAASGWPVILSHPCSPLRCPIRVCDTPETLMIAIRHTLEVPVISSRATTLLLRRMQSTAYCPKSLLACLCPPSRLSPSISSNLRTRGWTPASSERLPALPIQHSCLGLEHGCSCLISSLSWHLASPWPTAETMHICIVLKLMVQHRARSLPAGRGEGSAGGRLLAVNTSAAERAGRTKSYFS